MVTSEAFPVIWIYMKIECINFTISIILTKIMGLLIPSPFVSAFEDNLEGVKVIDTEVVDVVVDSPFPNIK